MFLETYESYLKGLGEKLSRDKMFDEETLEEIDEIRTRALMKLEQGGGSKLYTLLERNNNILRTHYKNKLDLQKEKLSKEPGRDTIAEFGCLIYVLNHLGENKSIEQLKKEAIEDAEEVMAAGDKLAYVLGVNPL